MHTPTSWTYFIEINGNHGAVLTGVDALDVLVPDARQGAPVHDVAGRCVEFHDGHAALALGYVTATRIQSVNEDSKIRRNFVNLTLCTS